eukprot:3699342-Pleurochrysis_carterae.AAC.2
MTTKDYYTVGELYKEYGVKKNTGIIQEYSNVKRQHRILLQEPEQGALKIIWERHKGEMLGTLEGMHDKGRADKVIDVKGKRQMAECWGGGEYLTKWNNGE